MDRMDKQMDRTVQSKTKRRIKLITTYILCKKFDTENFIE